MPMFRKKPVVIEARKYTGQGIGSAALLGKWMGLGVFQVGFDGSLEVPTLEGPLNAQVGDWIIKGVAGEFYPCKPDIFEASYEPAD